MENLGHTINAHGMHMSNQKVEAAPLPHNIQELKSFLGLLNYYAKIHAESSDYSASLHRLLQIGQPWVWSDKCEEAFRVAKKNLADARVLAHYDPRLPMVLAGDASAYGLGAVISHKLHDGSERLASRTLTASENRERGPLVGFWHQKVSSVPVWTKFCTTH